MDHNLCFNCGRSGHRAEQCRRRGCLKCKRKHHTSICDNRQRASSMQNEVSLTGYTTHVEERFSGLTLTQDQVAISYRERP